jgi:hypothetical protein
LFWSDEIEDESVSMMLLPAQEAIRLAIHRTGRF